MTPLADFSIVRTRDPAEAESVLSREIAELRLRDVDQPRFGLEMNGVHLGDTLVGYNRFDADTVVDAGEPRAAVVVVMGVGPPATTYVDGTPVLCTDTAPILGPPRTVVHHRPAGGGFLILRVDTEVLEQRLRSALNRNTHEPIRFDVSLDLASDLGLHLRNLIGQIVETAGHAQGVLTKPLIRSGYDDLLLNLILTLPSNYSAELSVEQPPTIAPAVVRRAEAFLEANASLPVTIDQLVKECGCSKRALFKAFRDTRGYTPMQFRTDCRLELARKALQVGAPGETVSSIAYDCGFSHPSRFAATYLKRFGELPSETRRGACS